MAEATLLNQSAVAALAFLDRIGRATEMMACMPTSAWGGGHREMQLLHPSPLAVG